MNSKWMVIKLLLGLSLALGLALAGCGDFDRGDPSDPSDPTETPVNGDPVDEDPNGDPVNGDPSNGDDEEDAPDYTRDVYPILNNNCAGCHGGWVTGDAAADYAGIVDRVNLGSPNASVLLTKARGQDHAAGEIIGADSDEYATILEWIEDGAEQ